MKLGAAGFHSYRNIVYKLNREDFWGTGVFIPVLFVLSKIVVNLESFIV